MDTKAAHASATCWQPDQQAVRDGIVLGLVRALLPALGGAAAMDPWGVADLLTSATPALDGKRPIDVLLTEPSSAARIAALIRSEYL